MEALPSYYLDSDEQRGRWHGRGADMLGLRGEVRDEDFLDVMAGVHPGSGGVFLGRAAGESSVRGFDITANAPKSVSVLFAVGDDFVHYETLASHEAAVAAMVRRRASRHRQDDCSQTGDPPQRITDIIGPRPPKGDRIRTWDTALGYLDQHQTAHNLTTGIGPTRGRGVTRASSTAGGPRRSWPSS